MTDSRSQPSIRTPYEWLCAAILAAVAGWIVVVACIAIPVIVYKKTGIVLW